MERYNRIELLSSAWKADALAIVLIPQIYQHVKERKKKTLNFAIQGRHLFSKS